MDSFETVVKFNQDDATSWFYLANSYEKLGNFTAAKSAYIKVIELRDEYLEAYKNLSLLLIKIQDYDNTIKYCLKAAELDKEDYLYEFLIATSMMKKRDFEEALNFLK